VQDKQNTQASWIPIQRNQTKSLEKTEALKNGAVALRKWMGLELRKAFATKA
jgi:hypothetical protein